MEPSIMLYTIGFTKKTASEFFTKLKVAGVSRVIDVRLNNISQLAGFSKKDDLKYFLHEICAIDYVHAEILAPTQPMLDDYKKRQGAWSAYERDFIDLMADRQIEKRITADLLSGACLLCSEDKPHYCHRRLVAEYLAQKLDNLSIVHLV